MTNKLQPQGIPNKKELIKRFGNRLTIADLKELYFKFGLEYEELQSGGGKREKAIELINYAERRNRLAELDRLSQELIDRGSLEPLIGEKHIPYYLSGIQVYWPGYVANIRNFQTSYLGKVNAPVPFGGRNRELAFLDRWLISSQKKRLLLTSPAGRGKSTLLMHWVQSLENRDDIAVVFFPISVRFKTNLEDVFFVCLATRLAYLYGKHIPANFVKFSSQFQQGLVAEYLQESLPDGRQLLIIIDGLDEAAWDVGPNIFPLDTHDSVRIVMSARYLAGKDKHPKWWLRQLGWEGFNEYIESQEIGSLTEAGVRDVLEKVEHPNLEQNTLTDIVREIFRLSEGDPLLVKLYAEDIQELVKTNEELVLDEFRKIQPGIKGFFEHWWEDQKKLWGSNDPFENELVSDVLDILSNAYGPISVEDIKAVIDQDNPPRSREVQKAISLLSRFILGDGKQQGFVFAHPLLRDFFQDQLTISEVQNWQCKFAYWGKEVVKKLANRSEKGLIFEEVSAYLINYYRQHLRRANSPIEEYVDLLSKGWMLASYRHTGSYAVFLNDVDAVWEMFKKANNQSIQSGETAPFIGWEIRCALYHASVQSLAENISDDLLAQLIEYSIWTWEQAIVFVRQKASQEERCQALLKLMTIANEEQRKTLLKEAHYSAEIIRNDEKKAEILSNIAEYQPKVSLISARKIKEESSRAFVLNKLAEYLPQEVLEETSRIEDETERSKVLQSLADSLPNEVLEKTEKIKTESLRASVLLSLAEHLPHDVLQSAKNIQDEISRAKVLSSLVYYMPQKVLLEIKRLRDRWSRAYVLSIYSYYLSYKDGLPFAQESLRIAKHISDEWDRHLILCILAKNIPQDVLEEVRLLKEEKYRADVLEDLAVYLPEEVLQAVEKIDFKRFRWPVLEALADYLPMEVLVAAKSIDDDIDQDYGRSEVLVILAPTLPQEVLNAALTIRGGWERAKVLISLAKHLPKEVLIATDSYLYDESHKASVLCSLAEYMPEKVMVAASNLNEESSRSQVLVCLAKFLPVEVLKEVNHIGEDFLKVNILNSLINCLPIEKRSELVQAKLKIAEKIDDVWAKVLFVSKLIKNLPSQDRKSVVEKTLQDLSSIKKDIYRERILCNLAEYQPREVLQEALKINDELYRSYVLRILGEYIPLVVLWASSDFVNVIHRADVLCEITKYIPKEVLEEVSNLWDERERAKVLRSLAKHLPQEVLHASSKIKDEQSQANVLYTLIEYYPSEALEVAKNFEDSWSQYGVYSSLKSIMPLEVLEATNSMQDSWVRAKILSELVQYLPPDVRRITAKEVFLMADDISNEVFRSNVLIHLVKLFPHDVLQATRKFEGESERLRLLGSLARHLPDEVWMQTNNIKNEANQARLLSSIIKYLPSEQQSVALDKSLQTAVSTEDDLAQLIILQNLAEYLPHEVLREAIKFENKNFQMDLLEELTKYLPQNDFYHAIQEVIQDACSIEDLSSSSHELVKLVDFTTGFTQFQLHEIWQKSLSNLAKRKRSRFYMDVASFLPIIDKLGGTAALKETILAVEDVNNWWP